MASETLTLFQRLSQWFQRKLIRLSAEVTCYIALVSLFSLLIVGMVISADVAVVAFKKSYNDWLPSSKTSGQIIVDSPKVYTRERLVNDRLEEVNWLESQLKSSEDQLFKSQFVSVAGKLTTLKRDELRIIERAESPKGQDATPTAESTDKTQQSVSPQTSLQPTELTIDRFRDLHAFREEVRAEMMQTQLDDRHDLGANTVYRLTFDTTIVSGLNTRTLAWINVSLVGDDSNNRAIFDDWQDKVATDATRLLRTQHRSLAEFGLTPDEQIRIFSFFVDELCNNNIDLDIKQKCMINILQFIDWYRQAEQSPRREVISQAVKDSPVDQPNIDEIYYQYDEFCYSKTRSTPPEKLNLVEFSFHSFMSGIDKKIPCTILGNSFGSIPDPYYRLFAVVDLYDRVKHTGHLLSEMSLEFIKGKCGSRYRNDPSSKAKFFEKNADGNLGTAGYPCPPLMPNRNWDIVNCAMAQYTKKDISSKIDEYFNVTISGEDKSACYIKLAPRIIPKLKYVYSHWSNVAGYNIVPLENILMTALNKDSSTFSYAVTPRNMMQRLGIISNDDDVISMVDRTKSDERLAMQAIAVLRERGRKLEFAQGFPIIVGHGSNYPSSLNSESKPTARFGWVIAPGVRGGDAYSNGQYVQTTQQYTLAAVVSVPSWWRRAQVTVTACWVDPSNLRLMPWYDSSVCPTMSETPPKMIALPGRVDEISRKLGFWVINEPYLDDGQHWQLTAGRKQAVVIRGARLWRSTAVTLGFQKADKIEVLPNMNGIIATFNCVQEHSGGDSPKLQVWTSEGATPPQDVTIAPSMGQSSCSDDGMPISVKPKADAPSLDDGQQWTLTAGRKQTMVVRGKRLWYGTVVTLGSQKADAIELLPGSNGVIATFDCLQEPEGPAMLQAWTSEGVTSPVSVAVSADGQHCPTTARQAPLQASNWQPFP